MFGFGKGSGSSSHERAYMKSSRQNSITPRHANTHSLSLEPAINGPPSPEGIRLYTEQVKRSSLLKNRSRSDAHMLSVAPFAYQPTCNEASKVTTKKVTEDRTPSRESSTRSNTSSMVRRGERPESMHLFSRAIFSRSRKSSIKGSNHSSTGTTPVQGPLLGGINEAPTENEASAARDKHYGIPKYRRTASQIQAYEDLENPAKGSISEPYNFQHVAHTHKEHLLSLDQSTGARLASEFSAIRASQVPTNRELKGIRAEELHFENFSSEALNEVHQNIKPFAADDWPRPKTSPHQQNRKVLRKRSSNQNISPRTLTNSHMNEFTNNRRTPPPRPPRSPVLSSPLSPECPVPLPPRVSSRTASGCFHAFNISEQPTSQRGQSDHMRGSSHEISPTSNPLQPPWRQADQFAIRDLPARPLMSPPIEAAWPLKSGNGNFGAELTDVPEEEENLVRGLKRSSVMISPEIRWSKCFANFPVVPTAKPVAQEGTINEQAERSKSVTLGKSISASIAQPPTSVSPERRFSRVLGASHDDWEDDIDYCYEHEAEADCDFEWKPPSIDYSVDKIDFTHQQNEIFTSESILGDQYQASSPSHKDYYARSPSPKSVARSMMPEEQRFSQSELNAEFDHPEFRRFRPSLLVPAPVDVPELSPLSLNSSDPGLHTPNAEYLPRNISHRPASFASSFKESHGFNLSPSLLVPQDFASQMEQDQLYEQLINTDPTALDAPADAFIFKPRGSSRNRESSIVEGNASARSSYRSSGFSRGSISCRSSNLSKNDSRESVLFSRNSIASCGGSNGNRHSSVPSTCSLPELFVSSRREEQIERGREVEQLTAKLNQIQVSSAERERDRINELLRERELHISTAPNATDTEERLNSFLSPVAESVVEGSDSMDRVCDDEGENATDSTTASTRDVTAPVPNFSRGHSRKISAPTISQTTRPQMTPRLRSASSANSVQQAGYRQHRETPRTSYQLFPGGNAF